MTLSRRRFAAATALAAVMAAAGVDLLHAHGFVAWDRQHWRLALAAWSGEASPLAPGMGVAALAAAATVLATFVAALVLPSEHILDLLAPPLRRAAAVMGRLAGRLDRALLSGESARAARRAARRQARRRDKPPAPKPMPQAAPVQESKQSPQPPRPAAPPAKPDAAAKAEPAAAPGPSQHTPEPAPAAPQSRPQSPPRPRRVAPEAAALAQIEEDCAALAAARGWTIARHVPLAGAELALVLAAGDGVWACHVEHAPDTWRAETKPLRDRLGEWTQPWGGRAIPSPVGQALRLAEALRLRLQRAGIEAEPQPLVLLTRATVENAAAAKPAWTALGATVVITHQAGPAARLALFEDWLPAATAPADEGLIDALSELATT